MSVESFTPTALQFTQGAAHKVKSLVDEEGNDRLKLRVFVTGGGCSGFQYGFTFDEEVAHDDTIVEREGVEPGGGSDELPVPGRCRGGLSGRSGRFALRDQESERQHYLWLRLFVFDLIALQRNAKRRRTSWVVRRFAVWRLRGVDSAEYAQAAGAGDARAIGGDAFETAMS